MPVAAMLQLTARCNLRCRHCYQLRRRLRELTTREWICLLEDLVEAGVLFLTLSGGEPLLRRDFFRIAEHARALRFSLSLKTNGLLLDRSAADRIGRLAFLEVEMSLYSSRAREHDAVTGLAGSHRGLLRAARMLARRSVGVVMSTPLMTLNADDVDAIVSLCESEGFQFRMDPSLCVREDGGCNPAALRMDPDQLRAVFSNPRLVNARAARRTARRRSLSDRVCGAGRTSSLVTPDGDVLICPLIPIPLGNVRARSFRDIWISSPLRASVDALTWGDLEGCSACDLMPWCTRCHGNALVEDGCLTGPSRLACAAAAALRDAAGRRRPG